jgi:quercetin dioxygenase-like cupin family protein
LEGEVDFQVGDEKITATPGTFIQGPKGIAHSFKTNTQLPARILPFAPPRKIRELLEQQQDLKDGNRPSSRRLPRK